MKLLKRQAWRGAALLLLAVLSVALPVAGRASAHAYSAAYTTLTISAAEMRVHYSIDELSVIEWVGGDANGNSMIDLDEFEATKAPFLEILKKNLILQTGGQKLDWTRIDSYELDREGDATKVILDLVYPAPADDGSISLKDTLYEKDSVSNYVNLLTIVYGPSQSTAALADNDRSWTIRLTDEEFSRLPADTSSAVSTAATDGQASPAASPNDEAAPAKSYTNSSTSGWLSFFKLGMHHILGGYDHLLFLFSLLIARQTFKQYASMITAFTIAHSVTLTMTVLGWISVPGSIVEPLIALSICYVAIDNIVRKNVSYRWVLTFLFGLVHGMGFADILVGMDIPHSSMAVDLASFNIGIEVVQLSLVTLCMPLLYAVHRLKYARQVVYAASSIALLLGGLWLIERIFL